MRIEEERLINTQVGYKCDICKKEFLFSDTYYSIRASTVDTEDMFGEKSHYDICSLKCLINALKKSYSTTNVVLSRDFLNTLRD